jgi:hypothetical protein
VKTISLKKVSAVAVASLGFGLLSAVPANATTTATAVTVVAASDVYGFTGTAAETPVSITTVTATAATQVLTLTPTVTNKPGSSTMTVGAAGSTQTGLITPVDGLTSFDTSTTADKWTNAVSSGVQTLTYSSGTIAAVSSVAISTLSLTATAAGTYQITITPTSSTGSPTLTAKVVTFRIYPTSAQATAAAIAGANSRIVSVLGDGGTPASTLTVTGVAGPANTVQVAAIGDTSTAALPRIVTVSGAGTYFTSAGGAGTTLASGTNPTTATVTSTGNYGTLTIATPTVGTATVTIASETASGSGIYSAAAETVTITINAAATSGAVSASTSTAFMNKNATINAATTEATAPLTTPAAASTAQVPAVSIQVTVGRANGAITGTTAVTASITGPGTLKMSANDTDPDNTEVATGRSISSTATTMLAGNDIFSVGVIPDGTAGVSTITITVGTYTVTKSVTFVGTVTSLTFNKVRGSIVDTADSVATGDTDAYAGFITGKDSAGNAVTLTAAEFTAVTAAQKTAAVITDAAVVAATAGTYSGVVVAADAPTVVIDPTATKTGNKTLTLTHTATGLTVVATFTVGLAQATTVTLSLDKPTYTAGEKMTLTITALDAGGFAIGDSSVASFLTAAGILGSVSVGGDSLVVTAPAFVNGKSSLTLYAPLSGGPVTFSTTTSTAATAPATAVTATATARVTDPNAALLTQIDALNAKIVALNALIAKIMKKLGVK